MILNISAIRRVFTGHSPPHLSLRLIAYLSFSTLIPKATLPASFTATMTSSNLLSILQRKLVAARESIHTSQKTQEIKAALKGAWKSLIPSNIRKHRLQATISQPSQHRTDPTSDGDLADPGYLIPSRAAPIPCPPRPTEAKEVSKWSPDTPEDHPAGLFRAASNAMARRLSWNKSNCTRAE